ncbi:hypothetical protein Tsubulata_004569 [Turnera subulata]|uniref:CCHC-type domain-containing protein n=1 Tax=Turnera subulata TaxID=218843 RepID=A0A9Q0FVM5_9ROSI|nr:hypothetical protein Tsubulata_004569 [Turnera subulata]
MERFDDDLNKEHFRVDLSKFKSNNPEDDVEEQLGDVISRTYLVGKVHSERFFNAGIFKSSLNQIQLHELPLDFLEGRKIREICKVFASAVEFDTKIESRLGWNGYIRARVEFFPEKPLVPRIHVKDSMGIEHWVKVRYERLGEFCYRCGRVTHATRRCSKPRRAFEGQELESIYSFGPWLRAKEAGHRPLMFKKPI